MRQPQTDKTAEQLLHLLDRAIPIIEAYIDHKERDGFWPTVAHGLLAEIRELRK